MPPHPELTDSQARQMLSWIFSLKSASPAAKPAARVYTYKLKNGSTRRLDFPVYTGMRSTTRTATAATARMQPVGNWRRI